MDVLEELATLIFKLFFCPEDVCRKIPKMFVHAYQTTCHHIVEGSSLHSHCCENQNCHMFIICLCDVAYVSRMGERRGADRALVGKPEGRRPLERPRHR
jgi:hypothetical protein